MEQKLAEVESKSAKEENRIYDMRLYRQSEICIKIMDVVEENQKKNFDEYETTSLSKSDFVLLLQSANKNLDNKIDKISNEFPKLKIEDLYYLCLIILELNDRQIASLFGVTYDAVWVRRNKICSIIGMSNDQLHIFLSNYF